MAWADLTEAEETAGPAPVRVGHVNGLPVPVRAIAPAEDAGAALAIARGRIAATHPAA